MIKKRLLLTVCMLCMFATLLFVPVLASHAAQADVVPLADEPNVILKSDGTAVPDELALSWQYGVNDEITYSFRPQHGDTVYYTVTKGGEAYEKFAVVYIGDNAMFYEVKSDAGNNDVVDTDTPFKVQSLNAYLKTLKTGSYSLAVNVPAGTAPAAHTHWYDTASGEVTCGVSYSAASISVGITVTAYDITDNVGDSASAKPIKYSVTSPAEVLYTGEANNVPQIDLTLDTGNGTLILVEGEDYELSSTAVDAGPAELTITGIGGLTGSVTIANAYQIVQAENSVTDVYVVRWKYGEYDRNVNLFTANVKWGADDMYFAIATDNSGSANSYVEGLDEIRLTDGVVSEQVEQLLNTLDANRIYYLYAVVGGGDNYYSAQDHTQFEVVEVTNTWTTTPNVVSWEWHSYDENVNAINAVPAFGAGVKFTVYTKDGSDYNVVKLGANDSFELEKDEETGEYKVPAGIADKLAELDAGTYYLFASLISDSDNYSSINETFSADALVPFRVLQARNYWTQIPKISNWAYGSYNEEVNAIAAAAAHGSSGIKYRIYQETESGIGVLNFNGTTSFSVNAQGALPKSVVDGLKTLGVGKYYLRAEVAATTNYTGLQEVVADFTQLPSFEVIKAENYWSTAPAINAWSKGNYNNDDNLPVAAAHYGTVRIVIVDVDDEENIIYDTANNINKLSEAKVGTYLLTATVAGTANYSELTFDTIFHVFVPETDTVGMAWWLVLIIVICSLGVLVFIFWLLHDKGILQMLTGKAIVAMRTKATMDATIAAVRANKVAEEAKQSVRLAEELDKLESEQFENAEDDSDDDEVGPILLERDEETGFATFVRYQRPFAVRLIQASDDTKEWYSYLKNLLLSYKKVKSKVSKGYDAFNCGRKQVAKFTIRGKTLCLYLALDPDEYEDTKYRVERSQSKKFAETPCMFRIKSQRRQKYAEELIVQMFEKLGILQGEVKNVDYRPPYETTEELIEKGLIKQIVYKKKFDSFIEENAVSSIVVKTDDEDHLEIQEVNAKDDEYVDISDENAAEEEDDWDEEVAPVLIERDEQSGFATFERFRRPFSVRLIQASDDTKEWYSYLKNVLLSYKKVKSKVSNGYDAFNSGRNQLAKLVIRGKTLCLYLALDPEEYEDTKYRVERSPSKKYSETPCLYRIKSQRRQKYAEELIAQLFDKLEIEQGEIKNEDYRPPYETTEELIEKGLITKVTYQRRIKSFINANQGAEGETKAEGQSKPVTQDDASDDHAAQPETPAAAEQEAAATETPSAESDAPADSDN